MARSVCAASRTAACKLLLLFTCVLTLIEGSSVAVSGTFFQTAFPWADYMLRNTSRADYTIILTLTGDTFVSDVATDLTKTKALVDVILVSNRRANEEGYEYSLEYQRDTYITDWRTHVTRDSDTQVTIGIPPLPTYAIDPDSYEFVGSASSPGSDWTGGIPASAVASGVVANFTNPNLIETSLEPLVGTIVSAGVTGFFRSTEDCEKTATAIRLGPSVCPGTDPNDEVIQAGWMAKVELRRGGAQWHPRVAENQPLRELLLTKVLHSNHPKSHEGYENALDSQWRSALSHLKIILVSVNRVTVYIPPFPGYQLPPWTEQEFGETITMQPLSASLMDPTYTGPDISVFIGTTTVNIISSTAVYSGTFFREGGLEYWERVAISDEQMQLTSHGDIYTVIVELKGESFDYCIDMAPGQAGSCVGGLYQYLVDAVLHSNHRMTETGYDNALEKQIQNWDPYYILKENSQKVTIQIPKFPNYYLPAGFTEEIEAQTLPGNLFASGAPLANQFGTVNVLLASRTATYSGSFFSPAPKTDDHILSAESWTVEITLVVDKWSDDLFNTPWRHQMLLDAVFSSNKNATAPGYEHAFETQRQQQSIAIVRNNPRKITLTVPSFPTYRLLPNTDVMNAAGAEVISAQALPWQLLDGHSNLVKQFGISSVTIMSRTAHYTVGQMNDRDLFFPLLPQGSEFLPDYWPTTTYRTDYEMNNPRTFVVLIELVNAQWALDVKTNTTKRQNLIDQVLHSNRLASDAGYENALATQRHNFPESLVDRVTPWALTITVPQYENYTLPTNGSETIDAAPLPAVCLIDHYGMQMTAELPNKLGTSSMTLFARTVRYSGTFFSNDYKTEYHFLQPTTFSIIMDLVAEEWRSDVVTNSTKRMALIRAVLSSSRAKTDVGYETALAFQTETFAESLVERVTPSRIIITIPQYATYDLPPSGEEYIETLNIPAICVADGVDIVYKVGLSHLQVYSRTATYTGNFFDASTYKTESDIRGFTFTITITLYAEQWPTDIVTNQTKRQALVDAVLHSNRSSTDTGYESAMHGLTRNFSSSNMIRDSNTTLRIMTPVLTTYALPGQGSEVITTIDLPALTTLSQGAVIVKKTGVSTLRINARTAIFTGTLFSTTSKTEYSLKSFIFEIVIKLEYENWRQDIAHDRTLRNALTDAVLQSDKPAGGSCNVATYSAYECAMETQRNTICSQDPTVHTCSNLQIQDFCSLADQAINPTECNTQIKITIPSMLNYRLPPLGTETISAGHIPSIVTQGISDVIFQVGQLEVVINARTAVFSGSFFSQNQKTDEDMQSDTEFTVYIDLVAETWVSNVAALRQDLVDLIFVSDRDQSETGFSQAFQYQSMNWPAAKFNRTSDTQVLITVPKLSTYVLPPEESETITAGIIPSTYVTAADSVDLVTGNRSLLIVARTVKYSGTFFAGTPATPGFVKDDYIRAASHTVIIQLLGDYFQPDVSTNDTKRLALLASVLNSNQSVSSAGYENAMATQRTSIPSSNVVLSFGNSIVTITIPALPGYDIPGRGVELITASIPSEAVLGATDITTTNDVHSILIQARTALYTGTFFPGLSEDSVTADDITSPPVGGFTIIITLELETWDVNIRNDPNKRQLLIDTVLNSTQSKDVPGYEAALDFQTQNFDIDDVAIDYGANKLTITLPAYPEALDAFGNVVRPAYFLPTSTSELISAQALSADLLGSSTGLTANQQFGDTSVSINAAAATYYGDFYNSAFKTDDDIRSTDIWTITIVLYGTQWPSSIDDGSGQHQLLAETLLASNHASSETGYANAMTGSIQSFPHTSITRNSTTTLVFSVPSLSSYELPAFGSEAIALPATGLPAAVLTGVVPLRNAIGWTNLTIRARSATFSGSFFDPTTYKTDEEVRLQGGYTVTIDITLATWHPDVATNSTIVADLVANVFISNHGIGEAGYTEAFLKQVQNNMTTSHVSRVNDTRITITVPPMVAYGLPALGSEIVSAGAIPASALSSKTSLVSRSGILSVEIKARSAVYVDDTNLYPQPFFRVTGDTDDTMRETFLARTIAISLVAAEWVSDVATNNATKDALIDAIFVSNKSQAEAGYATAFDFQRSALKAGAVTFNRQSNSLLVLTVRQLASYALPELQSEVIEATALPAAAVLGTLDIALKSGPSSLHILARTATYGSSSAFEFFAFPELNDAHLQDVNSYSVTITLFADTWRSNIAQSASLKSTLVASVLASNRHPSEAGYENALAGRLALGTYSVVRNSDQQITIVIPQMQGYSLPPGGSETIAAGVIPQTLVNGINQISLKTGTSTNLITARTATVTGTFFHSTFKTVEDLNANSTFVVEISLLGDKWDAAVASDSTKRQALIDGMLDSDKAPGDAGYSQAWEANRVSWSASNIVRANDSTVLITVPQFASYQLQPGETETVAFSSIPGQCVTSSSLPIQQSQGTFSVSLRSRSAAYSGTFFRTESRIDGDITNVIEYPIVITLANEEWHPNVATDPILRQALVEAVLVSDKLATDSGFDLALQAQIQPFSPAYIQRQSATQVTITIPQYLTYYLPPFTNETITTTDIPAACVVGSAQFPVDVTAATGTRSVMIKARTAQFEGNFFSCETNTCSSSFAKTDEAVRAGAGGSLYYVKVTLIGNTWLSDVSSSTSRRMSLLRSVFNSDKSVSTTGYENSFDYFTDNSQVSMWPEKADASLISPGVYRQDDSVVIIVIPSIATYALPGGGGEILTAAGVPRECQDGSEDIVTMAGIRSLQIVPRTATYASSAGSFFSTQYKTDDQMRNAASPYVIQIQLTHATWDLDVATPPNTVTDSGKRDALVRAVLVSSVPDSTTGYTNALDKQLDLYVSSVGVNYVYQNSADTVTIYVPQLILGITGFSDYTLPALGSEVISVGAIPASVISSGTAMPAISTLGQTSLEIKARTIEFGGDFFSATDKNDDNIRSLPSYTITMVLTATEWIANISSDATHRQNLVDAVLGSNRAISDAGYENAMVAQRAAFPEADVVRNSNTSVSIIMRPLPNYQLTPDSFEVLTPLDIPATLLQDAAIVTLKEGTRALTVRARTAQYTGSFFTSGGKTDSHLRGGDPTDSGFQWHIYIDLTYEMWAVDIVTDPTKRQGLVNIVLGSNRSSTDVGYQAATQHQIQSWPQNQMVRMSNWRVKISIPPIPGYDVPPFGTEIIAAEVIPSEFIVGSSSLLTKSGDSSVQITGRTAEYGGTFFQTEPRTDESIQDSSTYTITITLHGETWESDVVTDAVKRQALIQAVLFSSRVASDYGYEVAMTTQITNFAQGNVALDAGTNTVTITVPQFASYALIALGSETITAQALPASVVASPEPVTLQSGIRSVTIQGRSVTYSGTFFSQQQKLDDDLRNPATSYTVIATLTAEKWVSDIVSNAIKRQALVEAVLNSNQPTNAGGFENGFTKMIENFPAQYVYYNATESEYTVTITIPPFPNYIQGRSEDYFDSNEIVEASDLPALILQGSLPISAARMRAGVTPTCCWQVDIQPRNLRFTGTFFVASGKTAEDIQNDQEWDIIVDVFRDSWHPDIVSNDTLRTLLIQSVMGSNHPYTEPGYENAMAKQTAFNFPANKVVRASDQQIIIKVPKFETYELPPTKDETISLSSIDPSLINGATAISLSQPCCSLAGETSVLIMSRTAIFSGTWFGTTKKQFEVRNVGAYTVIIDFWWSSPYFGAQWSTDVISNKDTRQGLINAVFNSDKSNTTVGGKTDTVPNYENALALQLENFQSIHMNRVNQTRLIITVPAFPGYALPKYDNMETISSLDIPFAAVSGQIPVSQKLGSQQVILEGVFLLLNTSVTVPNAGVTGSVIVGFEAPHTVASDGVIVITAPGGYPTSQTNGYFLDNANAVNYGTITGLSGSISLTRSGQVITLSGFTGIPTSRVEIELTNIRSHAAAASEAWHVQTKDAAGNVIDEDITTLITTPAKNTLSGVQLTCDATLGPAVCLSSSQGVPNAGVTSSIAFSLVTLGSVSASGKIRVTFPTGFVLSGVTVLDLVGINNAWNGTHGTNVTSTVVGQTVEISGFAEIPTGTKSFLLTNIQSPASRLSDSFAIATSDDFDNPIDDVTTGLEFTPASGNITGATLGCDISAGVDVCGYTILTSGNYSTKVYAGVPNAGVKHSTIFTMNFTGQVDAGGRIVLAFPTGFELESPTLVASNLPGHSGLVLNTTSQTVTLSNFSSPVPSGPVSLTIGGIRSHASRLSEVFSVTTTDSVGNIYDHVTGMTATPTKGNITNVVITIPNSGVIGTVHVKFDISGNVPSTGRINVTVPHDYALGMYNQASGKLEFFAAAVNPSGQLSGNLYIVSIEESTNSAIIGGFNTITAGTVEFDLDYVKPGAGAAGTFSIQTQDANGYIFDDTRFGDQAGQATSEAGIAPVTGSLGDLELIAPTAGVKSGFDVVMTTIGEIESTGKILIGFPTGFEIKDVAVSNPAGRLWLSQSMVATANGTGNCNISTSCGGGVVTISGFERIAPGKLSFRLENIRSPAVGTYPFQVQTGDISGFVIDIMSKNVSVTRTLLTNTSVEVQNAGVEGDLVLGFQNPAYTPADGEVRFTLPSTTKFGLPSPFVLGAVSLVTYSGTLTGSTPTITTSGVTVTLTGMGSLPPGMLSVTFANVRSPGSTETAPFLLQTLDANGALLSENPGLQTITPSAGRLSTVNMIFPPAGTLGTMNVSFATQGTLLGRGKVKITFPSSFELPIQKIHAHSPSGVLDAATEMSVETDVPNKQMTISVNGDIPRGYLSFMLYPMQIPVGFSAGVFHVVTTDHGSPDRVFDQVDYVIINPVDIQYWTEAELEHRSSVEVIVAPSS